MKTDTIILSIHPAHVKKILNGEKLYEYRKRIPLDIRYIVVYATAPTKKIVALIEIDDIIRDRPVNLWGKTKNHAGISYNFFREYFRGCQDSYAIKFRSVLKLENPMPLTSMDYLHAPQSYVYVDKSFDELKILLKVCNEE